VSLKMIQQELLEVWVEMGKYLDLSLLQEKQVVEHFVLVVWDP